MRKKVNRNRGFSLVELLISMALLSIVMLMVVQFMSSTSAANRKTRQNLNIQTEADEVMGSIIDSIMAASYIRVGVADSSYYRVNLATDTEPDSRTTGDVAKKYNLTTDKLAAIDFDLVPDNYGNYIDPDQDDSNKAERKVIIDQDTFQLLAEKNSTPYPLTGDLETANVRSFQVLKQDDKYFYVRPEYIYVEYADVDASGNKITSAVMYHFVENTTDAGKKAGGTTQDKKHRVSVYVARDVVTATEFSKYDKLKSAVGDSGDIGLLSKNMQDFYLSADVDGNALLLDSVFKSEGENGYTYHAEQTVRCRNSNVLSVRPQSRLNKAETGGKTGGEVE